MKRKKLLKFIQKPFSSLDRNIHAELDDIKGLLRVALIKIAYLESSLVLSAESSLEGSVDIELEASAPDGKVHRDSTVDTET